MTLSCNDWYYISVLIDMQIIYHHHHHHHHHHHNYYYYYVCCNDQCVQPPVTSCRIGIVRSFRSGAETRPWTTRLFTTRWCVLSATGPASRRRSRRSPITSAGRTSSSCRTTRTGRSAGTSRGLSRTSSAATKTTRSPG